MAEPLPGQVHIRRRALTVLQRLLVAAEPREGCALLLGRRATGAHALEPGSAWRAADATAVTAAGAASAPDMAPDLEIRLVWPCLNVWEPPAEQTRRFRLDPREQLLAQRWGRQRGLQVLGAAHSHPRSAAVPSATDLELAVAPTLQLILSPLEDWDPACWWLEPGMDDLCRPRRLPWKMMD